jgi:putative cardiolipin synthase
MKTLSNLTPAVFLMATACSTVDRNPERIESAHHAPASKGLVASEVEAATADFPPGHSGFHLLERADEALNWRLALVDHATRSIDIQYYLWHSDETGLLLLSRLFEAADRGVRVRILLDDLLFEEKEKRMAALCHHPNVEIRMFNPRFVRNGVLPEALEFLCRFEKLNRRMHNKVFCVDNRVAILGGRNIGNEYFGLGDDFNFVDLDVMTVGPVVPDVSKSFDAFWNSELSHPGEAFSRSTGPDQMPVVLSKMREYVESRSEFLAEHSYPTAWKNWSREFAALRTQWHTGPAIVVDDTPSDGGDDERFVEKAVALLGGRGSGELVFSSPYLLPCEEVNEIIDRYRTNGAEVRLLTASLAANNHLIVHSHYRKHRRPILSDGVNLHEMRKDPSEKVRALGDTYPFRSDKVALHVKAGVGDRRRCFIGSLNLDPRAIDLNTENGLLIESPSLSRELAAHLDLLTDDENAWEVTMDENRQLIWRSRGAELRIQPAPNAGVRVVDFFLGLLPIESLL